MIDQTNKREIADWIGYCKNHCQLFILCNSIISIIEVHPASFGPHSVDVLFNRVRTAEIRWQLPRNQHGNEASIINLDYF